MSRFDVPAIVKRAKPREVRLLHFLTSMLLRRANRNMLQPLALIAAFGVAGCGDDAVYCPSATKAVQPGLPCCFTATHAYPTGVCTVGDRCSDYDAFEGVNCDCPMGQWTCHGGSGFDMSQPVPVDMSRAFDFMPVD